MRTLQELSRERHGLGGSSWRRDTQLRGVGEEPVDQALAHQGGDGRVDGDVAGGENPVLSGLDRGDGGREVQAIQPLVGKGASLVRFQQRAEEATSRSRSAKSGSGTSTASRSASVSASKCSVATLVTGRRVTFKGGAPFGLTSSCDPDKWQVGAFADHPASPTYITYLIQSGACQALD
ncbi:hypothetical protein ACWGHA_26305 [Streptomyces xanthophaeus]